MPRIDIDALEEEWDEDLAPPMRAPGPRDRPDASHHPVGRVLGLHKGFVDLLVDDAELQAVYGGAMRGEHVVVGDRVRVRPPRRTTDTARIVDRLERDTVLLRTADDALQEERVLAANVDLAIAVIGAGEGDVGARFVDRILVAAEAGGLEGAVCINKIDEQDPDETMIARYRVLGYPVVTTSARTGAGIDELRRMLHDAWTVLTGHSGVGKTSLTNLLVPGSDREVAEIGRHGGRHTTVSPHAMRVPDVDGAWLVDTPGVRSFGIGHIAPDELAFTFPELRDLDCDLPGCLHDDEPGCAVPGRLGQGIDAIRYDSYRRFLGVLRGDPDDW